MRFNNDTPEQGNKIKVVIKAIKGDIIVCKHLTSGMEVNAYIKQGVHVDIGQEVILEYKKKLYNGGYIIYDTLMEEIEAIVLDAQKIINDGVLYTSLVIENTSNKKRLHSLVDSNDKLFGDTSVIVTGDMVKVKINNGRIFSIQT